MGDRRVEVESPDSQLRDRFYRSTGEHRGNFKVAVPFPVEIDLTEIRRL